MKRSFTLFAFAAMLFASTAQAEDQTTKYSTGERGTKASLSTVLHKGIEQKGLTMAEKWSHDVVVCKRTQMTGSRFFFKVCHTRAEWQAMRANGRETASHAQRLSRINGF